jgi:peptidoglycan hydrolase CwlO-like protein
MGVEGESSTAVLPPDLRDALLEIDRHRKAAAGLSAALTQLRTEQRRINDIYASDGGPVRKIQSLERHIAQSRQQLRDLYRRFGKQAEEAAGPGEAAGEAAGAKGAADAAFPLEGDDELTLERIRKTRDIIRDYEVQTEKLKASLAIDEEQGKIARMERTIEDHRRRVKAAEEDIKGLSREIDEANARIRDLMSRM